MTHSFCVDIAQKYGVYCAIILNHLNFWIAKNAANEKNFFDGHYWTYSSVKAFANLFSYMTDKQIRNALATLEKEGLIITGNYNTSRYDRTKWYALTEKGESILLEENFHLPFWANGSLQKGEPIPDNNTDNKTDNIIDNKQNSESNTHKQFSPPTVEDVLDYCAERNNRVDAERFIDHYTAVGWMVGKNKMKDWKAAVRTWERRDAKNCDYKRAKEEEEERIEVSY